MDIDQLVAFERIMREGSFSRAAWTLHIAQPTISARIQALEHELGGPLFARSGRRVSLTALGATFLPYASRALAVLAEGLEAARLTQAGQRGRMTVGALNSLAGGFLGRALRFFSAAYPQVECLVRAGDHERIVELMRDGVVELGLVTWPCLDPLIADLTPLLMLREPVVLVAPRGHPLAGRGPVTQAEVIAQSQPLLVARWWRTTHPAVARMAAQADTTLDVPIEMARHLVLSGIGAGFFTRTHLVDELDADRVVEVPVCDLAPIFRDSALVRLPRSSPMSVATSAFVALVGEQAAQLGLLAGA